MSDTFTYCGCQYEPDEDFQREHWIEQRINAQEVILHCDLCDCDIKYEIVEYHNGEVVII